MKYTEFKTGLKTFKSDITDFKTLVYNRALEYQKAKINTLGANDKEILMGHINKKKTINHSINFDKPNQTVVSLHQAFPGPYGEDETYTSVIYLSDKLIDMTDQEFNDYLNNMRLIKKNIIKEKSVKFFNGDDEYLFTIDNVLTFNDVRVQIKELGLDGYYVMFGDKKCSIDYDGRVVYWPDGLFDTYDNQLIKLL